MSPTRCPAVAEHASRGTRYQCERAPHTGGTHESSYRNGTTFTWRDPDNGTAGIPIVGTRATNTKELP